MIRLLPILLLSSVLPARAQDPPNPDVIAYIDQYRSLAVEEMVRTGVPAAIKLAQGIVETQAGKGELVLRSNNHFGIKCKSNWTGGRAYHDDDATGECFRKYNNARESWRDHSDFLRSQPRYASLFLLDPADYEGWARGLKASGYATDPKYPEKLVRYIETYRLNEHSLAAIAHIQDGGVGSADLPSTPVPPRASASNHATGNIDAGVAVKKSGSQAPGSEGPLLHRVEPGETLYGLSRRYGVGQDGIMRLNGLASPNLLAGSVIRIPRK
jgi:LysM repeat protein